MAFINITADLSAVASALIRIAEAMERLSPPRPPAAPVATTRDSEETDSFHLSESPEQFQERLNHEAALAASLGVAPWSPAFQCAVDEMRQDLMKSEWEGRLITREEADDIMQQSFQAAKAQANER